MKNNSRAAFFSKADLSRYGLGGIGLSGALYVMGYFGKQIPEWIVWCILAVSILLILTHWIMPIMNLCRKRVDTPDKAIPCAIIPERIPLLTLFNKSADWEKNRENLELFVSAVRQAVLDRKIVIWGKMKGSDAAQTAINPLQEIPYDHWKNHAIELRGIDIGHGGVVNISNSDNRVITSKDEKGRRSLYRDFYLNSDAEKWLKTS